MTDQQFNNISDLQSALILLRNYKNGNILSADDVNQQISKAFNSDLSAF